jgi:hypothetical protein
LGGKRKGDKDTKGRRREVIIEQKGNCKDQHEN